MTVVEETKLQRGRPKTDDHIKMMINLTKDIVDELKRRKEIAGLPISYQVRTAVQEYLAKND
tara:strand:- start:595 stop:780 length:186 start_codon:yes stop_codon:yes gene_type:complete